MATSTQDHSFPHQEPTPYHLMLRTSDYAWWRPMVGILIAVAWFALGAGFVVDISGAFVALFQAGTWHKNFAADTDLGSLVPAGLLGVNLALASLIPLSWLIVRSVHRMRPRWLGSVVPRLRWRLLGICLGLSVVAMAAQILVGTLLPGAIGGLGGSPSTFTPSMAAGLLVVLLTTPLQAAGEEYLFRGYLMQAFGALFANRWVPIIATATLFALAHGTQNAPLFFDRFAFGITAGWLVTRTGGLEAGIALHVLNNGLSLGFSVLFGELSASLSSTSASWWYIGVTLTRSVVYTVLVVWVARRMNLQTHTQPPAHEPHPRVGATSLNA